MSFWSRMFGRTQVTAPEPASDFIWEFPLAYPSGGSAGNVSAIAPDELSARRLIMTQLDTSKVIIGPARKVGHA